VFNVSRYFRVPVGASAYITYNRMGMVIADVPIKCYVASIVRASRRRHQTYMAHKRLLNDKLMAGVKGAA